MKNFDNGILIVAHPDDECLFASSILQSISILIICFNDIPKEEDISFKRFNSVKSYPLRDLKVISLNLKQSEKAFLPINWLNINERFSGISGGYQRKSYDKTIMDFYRSRKASHLALFTKLRSICDIDPASNESSKLDRAEQILESVASVEEKAVVFFILRVMQGFLHQP